MSQRQLEFWTLPVGAVIIGADGDLYVKQYSHTVHRVDGSAEVPVNDDQEVQVDVESTLLNLLRDMVHPFEEGTCKDVLDAIRNQRTLRAQRFLDLIEP